MCTGRPTQADWHVHRQTDMCTGRPTQAFSLKMTEGLLSIAFAPLTLSPPGMMQLELMAVDADQDAGVDRMGMFSSPPRELAGYGGEVEKCTAPGARNSTQGQDELLAGGCLAVSMWYLMSDEERARATQ